MRRWLVAAALLVAACGEQAPAPGEAQTASAPMGAASTPGNVIGPSGAAGITTSLPMNADAVRAVVAGYAIASVEDQVEGDPFTAITLSDGSEEVFRLLPTADDHIHAITTRSARARGPAGEVVGQTLFGVAPPEQVEFCLSEFVEGAPGFACSTDADGRFWRVYRLPDGYDGPSGEFGDIEPDVLHEAVLVEMRWIAPRAS